MKPPRYLLVGLTLFCGVAEVFGQGSLTPPGAPTPTMKTLDQVEARIPLTGGTSTITISADGSYYLTGNITVATGDGIDINAQNVTLDLNGYTIASTDSSASGNGIYASSSSNLVVRNGHIRGTTSSSNGVFSGGGFYEGVYFVNGNTVQLENLDVTNIYDDGIYLNGSATADISHCQVNVASRAGIRAAVTAQAATTTIDHCQALNCGGNAIDGGNISDCTGTSVGSGAGITGSTVSNSTGNTSSGSGISAAFAISNCSGTSASGTGVYSPAGTISNSTGTSNSSVGLSGSIVINCQGFSTSGNGLSAYHAVTGSFGSSSTGSGIVTGGNTGISATNCYGQSSGTTSASYGIDCGGYGVALSCLGSETSGGYSIHAKVASSCSLQGPYQLSYNVDSH